MEFLQKDDGIQMQAMPLLVVDTLMQLPDWLESDDPKLRARLLPPAYEDDEEDEEEYRQAMGESLEHLFASRTALLRRDLAGVVMEAELEPEDDPTFSLFVPATHLAAWIACLQAGSHALYIMQGLQAEDLDRSNILAAEPLKQLGLLRLSVIQEVLVMLMEQEESG